MPLIEAIPDRIQTFLKAEQVSVDRLNVAISTDLLPDGIYGQEWLIISDTRLLVIHDREQCRHDILLSGITAAKIESLVGGGVLEIQISHEPQEILYFSNLCAKKFGKVAKWLNDIATKQEEIETLQEEEDERYCKRCGLLLPDTTGVCPACVQKRQVIRRLLSYLKPYRMQASTIGFFMVSGTLLSLVPPYFNKILIDDIFNASNITLERGFQMLGILVLVLLATQVIRTVLEVLAGRLHAWLAFRLATDIRDQLYNCLQRLSLKFYDKRQMGTVMSHITQDSDRLEVFLVDGIQWLVIDTLTIFGIGVVLFVMNWKLALFVLIPVPVLIWGTHAFWKRIRDLWHKTWYRWSKLHDIVSDSISGIKVVKAFAQEDQEIHRFHTHNEDLRMMGTRAERLWATYFPTMMFSTSIGGLIIWYVGGRGVLQTQLGLGTLMAFVAYLSMFYEPLRTIGRLVEWLSRSLTAAERIFEVLDTDPEQDETADLIAMPAIRGEIEFQNVTFGYESHKPVLHNIDLKIEPGEMIGLVGHSGAGKSTTINLICRFYEVDSGMLLIDGVDIRKLRLEDLRTQIGVVLQEPFLFNGTITENIAYANPDATREEIMEAAKAANAHDFIVKFPDGYDTQVGERGSRLSGGERQRISIARAILHNPPILILDEATSSVDTETEKEIQEAIQRLVENRTTLAIAHRFSTLRNANRLCVLKDGKIAELGTHDELMEKDGVYAKLVKMQREASQIRAVDG